MLSDAEPPTPAVVQLKMTAPPQAMLRGGRPLLNEDLLRFALLRFALRNVDAENAVLALAANSVRVDILGQ